MCGSEVIFFWVFGVGASIHMCNGFHEGARHAVRVDWFVPDGSIIFWRIAESPRNLAPTRAAPGYEKQGQEVATCSET